MLEHRDYPEMSIEVAIHGRGGQGVKTTGDLLVYSLFAAGYRVNGQPLYGGERMGAPVIYFLRFNRSGETIYDRSLVRRPQIMLIFDTSMLRSGTVSTAGLAAGGLLLLNSRKAAAEFAHLGPYRIVTIPASQIAKECGMVRGNVPILSPVMAGAFARITGLISMETLEKTVAKVAGDLAADRVEGNFVGLRRGFEAVEPVAGAFSAGEGGSDHGRGN